MMEQNGERETGKTPLRDSPDFGRLTNDFDKNKVAAYKGFRPICGQNTPYTYQCLSPPKQNQNGPESDGYRSRPCTAKWRFAMTDLAHSPAADILEPVRCNQCMWKGEEADLVLATDAEDGEYTNAACPKCLTDHYLVGFPEAVA